MKKIILTLFPLIFFTNFSMASDFLAPKATFKINRDIGYNDVWGYTDPQGREYALLGVQDGTSVLEVLSDGSLKDIAFISSPRSTWKDIKTYQNYAYIVNERGGGMQILDLSKLPINVHLANTYTGFYTSHNIFIDAERKILFAEGNHAEPVRILSLEDPLHPKQIASFGVECHDIYARDGLVYISEGGHGTIGIFNYENPNAPYLVKRFQIQNAGYVHNSWLSKDGDFLMTTEENTGKTMKTFDLRDLNNIVQMDEILGPGKLAHNTHIKGDFAFVSHYGSGFRLYDVSNPGQITEVAYWQKTSSPMPGFVSAWGAYPFFKSGHILVSDIEEGLIVLHHQSAQEN